MPRPDTRNWRQRRRTLSIFQSRVSRSRRERRDWSGTRGVIRLLAVSSRPVVPNVALLYALTAWDEPRRSQCVSMCLAAFGEGHRLMMVFWCRLIGLEGIMGRIS